MVHEGTQEVPGHQRRRAARIDGGEEADALLIEQAKLRVEVVRVAAVSDDPAGITGLMSSE